MSQLNDDSFPFDAFVIVILLLLSAGSIIICLNYVEVLIYFANKLTVLVVLTASVLSLLLALLAVLLKLQSRMVEGKVDTFLQRVKALEERDNDDEKIAEAILRLKKHAQIKSASAKKFLTFSTFAIYGSILIISISFSYMTVSFWQESIPTLFPVVECEDDDEDCEEKEDEE